MHDDRSLAPEDSTKLSWGQRLERTKLTPFVFVAFFGALAIMCGAAASVGYVVRHLSHPGTHVEPHGPSPDTRR